MAGKANKLMMTLVLLTGILMVVASVVSVESLHVHAGLVLLGATGGFLIAVALQNLNLLRQPRAHFRTFQKSGRVGD